jgi:hypothetical protein
MMGRQIGDQARFFYEFRLDDRVPKDHLLRRINRFLSPVLAACMSNCSPITARSAGPR